MLIEKEIERAVKKIHAFDTSVDKSEKDLDAIVCQVKTSLNSSTYNFSAVSSLTIKRDGKKRFVKRYDDLYSSENILCQCIKQILDKTFKVKYPNRNKMVRHLFDTIAAMVKMSDFTLVKFDFKDYFNSISVVYLFEKFIKSRLSDRLTIDLIANFVNNLQYAYAGLSTSNALAEIAGKFFDEAIEQTFSKMGLIYYERYIDDSVLILNKHIDEDEIRETLHQILSDIFHDGKIQTSVKSKTKFNTSKYKYISRRQLLTSAKVSIDYLGYEFWFSLKQNQKDIDLEYGITEAKRKKYNARIDKLIRAYADNPNPSSSDLELLRHRIAAFTSREVYVSKRFRSNVWKVKGFISNYGELRYFLDSGCIENDTLHFLKNMVEDAFTRVGVKKPYFLYTSPRTTCGYNLFDNMKSNKTLLLVDHIGYDYRSLVKLCEQIGIITIDSNGNRRGYGTLVKEYLIRVKVGY